MLKEYIAKNKDQIKKEICDLCNDQAIDYIFTLAKKGTFLFDIIFEHQNELFIEQSDRFVPIYSDRNINKHSDFSFLKGKRILLFDDSVRTGKHFKHTMEYLKEKLKSSCELDYLPAFFICYSIMKCPHYENLIEKNIMGTDLIVFNNCNSYGEYYKFCIEESDFFQNMTNGNSIDLPIFNMKISNVLDFRKYLQETFESYKQLDVGLIREKNDLDVVIFRDNCQLKQFFDDFLLSSMCKLKYQKEDDGWNVIVTAYALTNSIKYNKLFSWYKIIFKEYFGKISNLINQRDRYFVKMYRYLNYFISYYVGKYFANILKENNIILEYNDRNAIKQFGEKYNNYIKNIYEEYYTGIFSLLSTERKKTTLKEVSEELNYQKMTELIFKEVNMNKVNEESQFLEIGKLKKYFNTESNLELFDYTIVCQQERFAISNEVELSQDRKYVYRGFSPGECSIALLPYRANVFYAAIYELYEKSKQNYDSFMKNYSLFIKRIDRYFALEEFYKKEIIDKSKFDYLTEYYAKINRSNFKESIEAMEYILEDKSQYSIVMTRDSAKFILDSDDFDF